MGYTNDLTASVEAYIKKTLVEKIMSANEELALCNTAEEIRRYLSDSSTINTPDFVLRRYICKHHPELLEGIENHSELCEDFYHNWSAEVLEKIAKRLSDISKKRHGLNISKNSWMNYLNGGAVKKNRAFEIAFVLQMDIESTMELLLAYNMEPYSVRNPLELVCVFCQKNPDKYTWNDVEEILKCFEEGAKEQSCKKETLTEGKTVVIEGKIDEIFHSNLPDADTKQMLINYMVENSNEFIYFIKGKEKVYLPGYSLTRMNKFLNMMKYLAVLYPTYYSDVVESNGADVGQTKSYEKKVTNSSDGYPKLSDLQKAMFQTQDWLFNIWDIPSQKTKKQDIDENNLKVFDLFCKTYENHIWALDRLRESEAEVKFFERRDALLFSYFLINGYLQLLSENDKEQNKSIETLLENESEFDKQLNRVFEALEEMDNDNPLEKYDTIWQCINIILKELEYPSLYAPSAFDRFIILSLMSASPEELTPLILNQANLEDLESTV